MIRWWQWRKRARCPHVHVVGIYGDAIIASGWFRIRCLDCGRLLDGPVSIAVDRQRLVAESSSFGSEGSE